MNKVLTNLSTLALCLLSMAACTSENEKLLPDDPATLPEAGNDPTRREVTMTLKNTLNITTSDTKAGAPATKAIATDEENYLASLDVYVFGSATEDGEYTFQERFTYMNVPPDATPPGMKGNTMDLDITPGAEKNQYNAVLRIKKGLFVKLYAVANCPYLGDGILGNMNLGTPDKPEIYMNFGDYKPLTLANPGTTGTIVKDKGIPTEQQFLTFHNLLNGPDDVIELITMTGANTTPLDLTDFSVFARLQTGLKLTRTLARFDIINDATKSKFTIDGIYVGNARKGTNCFPITPYGTAPADLISWKGHPLKPDTQQPENPGGTPPTTSRTNSAIYCPPSPIEDGGYLVLHGKYQANLTDPVQDVVYRVPFKQANATGGFTNLEINPNHRYTIAITAADAYHVDFDITVADWDDADDINGFEPTEPEVVIKATTMSAGIVKSVTGDSLLVPHDGGTIKFELESPSIIETHSRVNYETFYGSKDWLEIDDASIETRMISVKNLTGQKIAYEVKIKDYADKTANPSDVHIGYLKIDWDGNEKIFTIIRGTSFTSYLDEDAGQTTRYAAVLMKDGNYWAPINVGAKTAINKVTKASDTDFTDDLGKVFQWGRKNGLPNTNDAAVYNAEKDGIDGVDGLGRPVQDDIVNKTMAKWDGKYITTNTMHDPDLHDNWLQINGKGQPNPDSGDMTANAWYQKLWNANEGESTTEAKKGIYDPCPEGWRVPTKAEWVTMAGETIGNGTWDDVNLRMLIDGKNTGETLYLPAAGIRRDMAKFIGEAGFYWTSTREIKDNGTNGYRAEVTAVGDGPGGIQATNRTDAASVRCIQDK